MPVLLPTGSRQPRTVPGLWSVPSECWLAKVQRNQELPIWTANEGLSTAVHRVVCSVSSRSTWKPQIKFTYFVASIYCSSTTQSLALSDKTFLTPVYIIAARKDSTCTYYNETTVLRPHRQYVRCTCGISFICGGKGDLVRPENVWTLTHQRWYRGLNYVLPKFLC